MPDNEREIVYWDSDGTERLMHTDQFQAINSILENSDQADGDLEICGYARMELPATKRMAEDVLDHLFEYCLEEHLDPEGSYSDAITDTMKEAAEKFIEAFKAEYVSWACEIVKRETIDVEEWIKENRPDWNQS